MDGKSLYEFYEKFLLLQFGIKNEVINWEYSDTLGPDEEAHYFNTNNKRYVLIFEDTGGLAVIDAFIQETINLNGLNYTYVEPMSGTHIAPSYRLSPPVPFQYCHNVTGCFTLLELHSAAIAS